MIAVFVIYLAVVIGIAIWSSRRSKSNNDFILGGKKLGGVALALSERSTGESAWLLLGLTGYAFAEGLSSIWVAIGCVIGILFIWIVMSGRLRKETDRTGALTIPSLLSRKFPGTERPIGLLSAIIVIFFFVFYIAAQFAGSGKIFHDTFGLDPLWGMIIGSVVVIIYTAFGGFMAVVATDAFQAILMIFTLIALPVILILVMATNNVNLVDSLHSAGPAMYSIKGNSTGAAAVLLILNGMSWALGYTGQPQLLSRMMALKSGKDVKIGMWVASIWTIIAYAGAILIGLGGYAVAKAGILGDSAANVIADAEKILPSMVVFLVNPILAGILLSGVVSAIMSTASSELILCSGAISEDVYGNIVKKRMHERKLILMNKLLTLGIGILAFLSVLLMKDTVYGLVSYAWAGIGSSFGPALLLLLFWKRFSRAGVFASLITGTLGAIVWKNFLLAPTGISERLGSFVLAFAMAVVFSLAFPEKSKSGVCETT